MIGIFLSMLLAVIVLRKAIDYATEPEGDKDCPPVPTGAGPSGPVRIQPAVTAAVVWVQRGGTLNDASCLSRTPVYGVVAVRELDDFRKRLPAMLTDPGPLLVELHTGLADKTPMTDRSGVPFHQQVESLRQKVQTAG